MTGRCDAHDGGRSRKGMDRFLRKPTWALPPEPSRRLQATVRSGAEGDGNQPLAPAQGWCECVDLVG